MKKRLVLLTALFAIAFSAFAEFKGETKTIGEISYFLPEVLSEKFMVEEKTPQKVFDFFNNDFYVYNNYSPMQKYSNTDEFIKAIQDGTFEMSWFNSLAWTGGSGAHRINENLGGLYQFVIGMYTGSVTYGDIGDEAVGNYRLLVASNNKVYDFIVWTNFRFVEYGQELTKLGYMKCEPDAESVNRYYWRGGDAPGFIKALAENSEKLPPKIKEFREAFEVFLNSIKFAK